MEEFDFGEARGHGFIAIRDLQPGEVVLREQSYAHIVLTNGDDDIIFDPEIFSHSNAKLVERVLQTATDDPASLSLILDVYPREDQMQHIPEAINQLISSIYPDDEKVHLWRFVTESFVRMHHPDLSTFLLCSHSLSLSMLLFLSLVSTLHFQAMGMADHLGISLHRVRCMVTLTCYTLSNGRGIGLFPRLSIFNHR